jgi:hypothetical protein
VVAPSHLYDWNPIRVGDVRTLLVHGGQVAIGGSCATFGSFPHVFLAVTGPGDIVGVPVAVAQTSALGPVAPNPVRNAARVRFALARPARVRIALFDLAGRRTREIVNGVLFGAGDHEAAISITGMQPGVYFLRLEAGRETTTLKLVTVR